MIDKTARGVPPNSSSDQAGPRDEQTAVNGADTILECPTCGKEMDCSGLNTGDMGVCEHCGAEFKMGGGDSTSDRETSDKAKTGGNDWRVVATIFSIVDALITVWFIVKAGDVLNAARLASGQAQSAMQASQIYNEATVALLYYICIILALLLGQVCVLATLVSSLARHGLIRWIEGQRNPTDTVDDSRRSTRSANDEGSQKLKDQG